MKEGLVERLQFVGGLSREYSLQILIAYFITRHSKVISTDKIYIGKRS